MTIVLITHSDDLGLRAERVIRMADGRVRSDSRNNPAVRPIPAINGAEKDSVVPVSRPPRPKSILPPFAVPDHG